MDRRQFLAAAPALLAGCPGDSGSGTAARSTDRTTEDTGTSPTFEPGDVTPVATATPSPEETGTPEVPTSEPTAVPAPKQSPTPTADPPEPASFSGRGNAAKRIDLVGGLVVVDGVYQGSGQFAVTLYPVEGGAGRRLVDTSGPHDGASAGLLDGGTYRMEVIAEKTYWRLTVRQPRPGSGMALPVYLDGSGSDVFGPYEFGGGDGTRTAAASHSHGGSFLAEVWPVVGDFSTVVFDRTGRFAGETTFEPPHIGYVEVTATGDWTLGLRGD